MNHHVRPARPDDAPLIFELVRELAEYEKLSHAVDATQDGIASALFAEHPRVFCDIAEWRAAGVGFALWFYNFSTFAGKAGIYLEDLFVEPQLRGRGIGKALLKHLARRCIDEGLGRLQWAVLDWNAPSIAAYRAMGATPVDDWTLYRLSGDALERLAA